MSSTSTPAEHDNDLGSDTALDDLGSDNTLDDLRNEVQ